MAKRILITGGAGFIGSHFADELLERGDEVRAFDALCSQSHGETGDVRITWSAVERICEAGAELNLRELTL